jgi:hypothetical protein
VRLISHLPALRHHEAGTVPLGSKAAMSHEGAVPVECRSIAVIIASDGPLCLAWGRPCVGLGEMLARWGARRSSAERLPRYVL